MIGIWPDRSGRGDKIKADNGSGGLYEIDVYKRQVYKCDAEGREAFGRFLNSVGFSEC